MQSTPAPGAPPAPDSEVTLVSVTMGDAQRHRRTRLDGEVLDWERVAREEPTWRAEYAVAHPWPHLLVTGLLDDELLDRVCSEQAAMDRGAMERWVTSRHVKRETHDPSLLGPAVRRIQEEFDSDRFVALVERITGIGGLSSDPGHYAAGLHETAPGGFTMVHKDFPLHPDSGLHHRVNVLLYPNRGWRKEWGGQLELWPYDMRACGRVVQPEANTLLIFATDRNSLHGLPTPVACPQGTTRLTLASYYYSAMRPRWETSGRLSTYRARPQDHPSVSRMMPRDAFWRAVPSRLQPPLMKSMSRLRAVLPGR